MEREREREQHQSLRYNLGDCHEEIRLSSCNNYLFEVESNHLLQLLTCPKPRLKTTPVI